jgi:hypothetical protein
VSRDGSTYGLSVTRSVTDFLLLRWENLGVWLFANLAKLQGELMKENETVDLKELENINSEMFHSFDPDDASWIIGGRPKLCAKVSGSRDQVDFEIDIEF